MMNRALICNILPPDYLVKLKASQAAFNFCERLIDGGCFDDVRSITPFSYKLPKDISYKEIIFYINNGRGYLGKIIRYFVLNVKLAWDVRRCDRIWFYNLSISSLLAYVILRFLFLKRIYVIMADYTLASSRTSLQGIIGWLLERCEGMISLSGRSCFKNVKKLKVKAGIIDNEMLIRNKKVSDIDRVTFLFSGTLASVTGYDMALKVFAQIPQAQLYISGNGSFPEQYRKYENIHFMGNMQYEDYLKLLNKSTICLNLRNPYLLENNNNFPSKILDYFSKGKIVLSTMQYSEIDGANYIYIPFEEQALIRSIKEILVIDNSELLKYSDNILFIRQNFSVESWKQTIQAVDSE